MANKTPEFLFHYTVGPKLRLIADAGALLPKGFGAAPNEKPVLWLSENPTWEPTANKVMSRDGGKTFVRPTLHELQEVAGLYRFRVDTRRLAQFGGDVRLVPWSRMGTAARIVPAQMADMVRRGLLFGATPTHWWGCMDPLPLVLEAGGCLTIEIGDAAPVGQQQTWERVSMAQALASFEASGVQVSMTTATNLPAARNI